MCYNHTAHTKEKLKITQKGQILLDQHAVGGNHHSDICPCCLVALMLSTIMVKTEDSSAQRAQREAKKYVSHLLSGCCSDRCNEEKASDLWEGRVDLRAASLKSSLPCSIIGMFCNQYCVYEFWISKPEILWEPVDGNRLQDEKKAGAACTVLSCDWVALKACGAGQC